MRKTLLVLGICCVLATPAWAGGGFSLFGSYWEVNDDGQVLGIGGRASFGGEKWVFDLTGTWYPSADNIVIVEDPVVVDKLQTIPVDLGFRYLFQTSGSFKPYVGAGGSLFFNNLNSGRIGTEVGYYGLLGFSLGKQDMKFFADVLYRAATADVIYDSVIDPVSERVDLGGFGINAGLTWSF